ncbi:SanA/YdcF family protein [Flexithrix dorotheae]|uniref:SanA/YdcF family protein n=1 Tax=Flexithrix dorotheae TaxID=70993 RepID=UPI000377B79F|nr:ElyC/SanA/YdcF family protein [Flexithrix dorotheae]
MKRIFSIKIIFRLFLTGIILTAILIIVCHWQIESFSQPHVYENLDEIPKNKVGLLLGTSKHLIQGGQNPYFKYRIDAAERLFNSGKIEFILVSGDNQTRSYNEPVDMQKALMKRNIPEEKIILDYAGFRTLDSVIRCKKVFGQNEVTIISQEFHNKRAIYISRKSGLKAIGYNARDVTLSRGLKVQTREALARVKLFIDLYITNQGPKFLGDKIEIK